MRARQSHRLWVKGGCEAVDGIMVTLELCGSGRASPSRSGQTL